MKQNIVIPMAGKGSRFADAGYAVPKPFLPLGGQRMITKVILNISEPGDRVILVYRPEHARYLFNSRREPAGPTKIIVPNKSGKDLEFLCVPAQPHKGQAEAVLQAMPYIDKDAGLVIANSDQWLDYDRKAWRSLLPAVDGALMTFHCPERDPKWSYARTDQDGRVTKTAEKVPISTKATVGIYYFRMPSDFVMAAGAMDAADERLNGELYVSPAYNHLVGSRHIRTFKVRRMFGLGVPEEYERNRAILEARWERERRRKAESK